MKHILPSRKLNLWLIVGQSNAVGTTTNGRVLQTTDFDDRILIWDYSGSDGVWEYQSNGWKTFADYIGGFGPERGFMRRFIRFNNSGGSYGCIKVAVNGQPLQKFYNSDMSNFWASVIKPQVDAAITAAESAGYVVEVSGCLFLQGTADAGNETWANEYATKLSELIAAYRAEWNSNMQFVVSDHPPAFSSETYAPEVRAAFASVALSDALVFIASTDGAETVGDNVHYTSESKELVGRRMSDAVISQQSVLPE